MSKKPRVYLDTTVISALYDDRNPERRLLTEAFFKEIKNFEIFISEITVAEIERTPNIELKNKMSKAVTQFAILPLTDEVEGLANQYVSHGAVPEDYPEDAYHIAIAVISEVDYLLSWNFKHIVRKKTKDIVRAVNILNHKRPIEIMTPAELL